MAVDGYAAHGASHAPTPASPSPTPASPSPTPASPSITAMAPQAATTFSAAGDVVFKVGGESFTVPWSKLQAYPDSLLTELATAAAEQAGVMTAPITLNREPTLFRYVLRLLDKPAFLQLQVPAAVTARVMGTPWVEDREAAEVAFARAFDEELDYYGIVPSATLLPASFVAARRERLLALSAPVVSSIVGQIAQHVQRSCEEFIDKVTSSGTTQPGLSFFLSDPEATSWSEASVRLVDYADQASVHQIYQQILSYCDAAWLERHGKRVSLPEINSGGDLSLSNHDLLERFKQFPIAEPHRCPSHVQVALQTRLKTLGYQANFQNGCLLTIAWPDCGVWCLKRS